MSSGDLPLCKVATNPKEGAPDSQKARPVQTIPRKTGGEGDGSRRSLTGLSSESGYLVFQSVDFMAAGGGQTDLAEWGLLEG